MKHITLPRPCAPCAPRLPKPRPLAGHRYGCMAGCRLPFTIFAIVDATEVSSFVPNNLIFISPNSGMYIRGLVWRSIASYSGTFGSFAHLASSAKPCSADNIIVGSLNLAGADATALQAVVRWLLPLKCYVQPSGPPTPPSMLLSHLRSKRGGS